MRDKVVVITGASRGIGAAAARAFAAEGARVALLARSVAEVERIAAEIGPAAMAMGCDVADFAAVSGAIAAVMARFGRLDVLVNNAGVIEPIARLAEADVAEWGRAQDVNLKGVFHGMRAAIPVMRAQGGGTIITVSSGAAVRALEGWSAYCASKAGALMLTQAAHPGVGPVAGDGGDGDAGKDQGVGREPGEPVGLGRPHPGGLAGAGAGLDVRACGG